MSKIFTGGEGFYLSINGRIYSSAIGSPAVTESMLTTEGLSGVFAKINCWGLGKGCNDE